MPRLTGGRTRGPLFLTTRRAPTLDMCPTTKRARLSLTNQGRTPEELLAHPEHYDAWTLHQLRHSALTHEAEDGTNTPPCSPAPSTPPSAPWSATPASTLSPPATPPPADTANGCSLTSSNTASRDPLPRHRLQQLELVMRGTDVLDFPRSTLRGAQRRRPAASAGQ
ncbi:hypothetical protein [Actinomadura darangshiensis]|uniref:hypothetical protein n=1 Tax=Actinomadura darangshiensis TaxID=705336 RepID=UPI001A9DB849|nr:hypothetical protein [Actinomadura darangshiensis]